MTNTSLKLRNPLPENVVGLLAAISATTQSLGIDYLVIGATARDIILNHLFEVEIQRATRDIDFGVAVKSWEEFSILKQVLVEKFDFRCDQNVEHRLYFGSHPNEIEADLVPFGDIAASDRKIVFPKSEFTMNIAGFRESFEERLVIEIHSELSVNVASLASIVILKFIAFDDRPHERSDDIADILFIARKYLDAGNIDRLYDADYDVLKEESFDIRTAGARLLGRDITRISVSETREILLKQLDDLDRYSDHDSMILREILIGIAERI